MAGPFTLMGKGVHSQKESIKPVSGSSLTGSGFLFSAEGPGVMVQEMLTDSISLVINEEEYE